MSDISEALVIVLNRVAAQLVKVALAVRSVLSLRAGCAQAAYWCQSHHTARRLDELTSICQDLSSHVAHVTLER